MTTSIITASGTWTPRFTVGGSELTSSYSDQEGWYQRVGNTVTVLCYVRRTFSASGETIAISNLPFAKATDLSWWPAWVSLSTLGAGSAYARHRSSTGIFIVDSKDEFGTTTWTFSGFDVRVSCGSTYRIDV